MTPITAILGIGSKLIDRLWPDPAKAAEAKIELIKLQESGELQRMAMEVDLIKGQIKVNEVEAASSSLFVAGWRPFIGWVCGAAFAFKFVGGPMLVFAAGYFGHSITLPVLDFTEMSTILLGMLGIGGLRTIEKVKGVA